MQETEPNDRPSSLHVMLIGDFPADYSRPRGGVESVSFNIASGLAAAGAKVTVLRFGVEGEPSPSPPEFEVIDLPRRRPGSLGNWLVSPFEVSRIVRRVDPDVVHIQGIPELYAGDHPPAVLTIHGIPYRDAAYGAGLARRYIQPLIIRSSFAHALTRHRHVISISPYVGKELATRRWLQLHEIANPVEEAFFDVERSPEPGSVLYVGVLSRRKNVVGLVESAAIARRSIPQLRLRLAGPWLGDTEAETQEAIDRHSMGRSIEILGSLSRQELLRELARTSCVALASLQETAPMAIAEAMAAGVPVAATNVGGVGSMLRDGETGLLSAPGDMHGMATNLTELLRNDALRDRMGRVARNDALERYHIDRVVDRTFAVYRQAIDEARS